MLGQVYIPLLQAQAARTAQAGKLLQAEDAPMARGVLGTLNKFEGHVRSIMHQSQGVLAVSGLSLAGTAEWGLTTPSMVWGLLVQRHAPLSS